MGCHLEDLTLGMDGEKESRESMILVKLNDDDFIYCQSHSFGCLNESKRKKSCKVRIFFKNSVDKMM